MCNLKIQNGGSCEAIVLKLENWRFLQDKANGNLSSLSDFWTREFSVQCRSLQCYGKLKIQNNRVTKSENSKLWIQDGE